MASVGSVLRRARLQAGVTLEQISTRTCIPVKILGAIETDDLRQITSGFFYKSFVRQFCQSISLPYNAVSESVQDSLNFYPDPLKPEQLRSVAQHAVVKTRRKSLNLRSWLAAGSAVMALAVCSAIYSYWQAHSHPSFDLSAAVAHTGDWFAGLLPGRTDSPAKVQSEAGVVLTPQSSPPAAQLQEQNGERFRVEVSAIEPSWLSITADGHQTFSGILEPAERKIVEGRNKGRVKTGNAGGLKVVFNGRAVGPVGSRGQVRVVVFTKSNFEVLDPERASTARIQMPLTSKFFPAMLLANSFAEMTSVRPFPGR